jgi:hypothetical protein
LEYNDEIKTGLELLERMKQEYPNENSKRNNLSES